MYTAGDSLPIENLPSGSILVSGPAMSGKYELLLEFIAEGDRLGDGELFVTTSKSAESILSDFETRTGGGIARLRLVDCVSEQQSLEEQFPEDRVEHVNSPGDMTGVGIGVSEQLRRFVEGETEHVRAAFHSLSTLLMYAEVETVFRFLHVLTGRLDGVNAVGLFTIDPTTHDEQTVNTLKQLFDGAIELREENGGPEIRFVGLPDTPDGWINLE